jgi:hypothetical protein
MRYRRLRVSAGRRRRARAIVLALLALAGVAFAVSHLRSSSAPVVTVDWQTGDNSAFSNLECAHPDTQFAVVTEPVRQGRYAARFSETGRDVWTNGTVRCLDGRYDPIATTGDDYYFGLSVYIPAAGIGDNLIWELHQPRTLYSLPGCGVAPLAILVHSDGFDLRIAAGDCTVGSGFASTAAIPFPNLKHYPRKRWIDFVLHVGFEEADTGFVEAWSRTAGTPWSERPQIARRAIATMPFCSTHGIYNVELYSEIGLYPGYAGYSGTDTLYADGYRRGSSFADVAAPDSPAG